MSIVFCLFLWLFIQRVQLKTYNSNYISRDTTIQINGIFVCLVFLSHFIQYIENDMPLSVIYNGIRGFLGQLVVAPFLFYSGYGIYESIKKKKDRYVDQLPGKVIKLAFSFTLVIVLFLIVSFIVKKTYSLSRIVLSFLGWSSIGNSNWYFFDIVLLYMLVYVSFKFCKRYALWCFFGFSLVSIFVLAIYKETWWYDTFLCFCLGMVYSKYKKEYEDFILRDKKTYKRTGLIFLILFFLCFIARDTYVLFYILQSLIFVLIINHISMKVQIQSKMFAWIGDHIFEIYTLQRIPMIILKYYGISDYYFLYFFLCLFITIILSILMKKVNKKVMS